MKRLFPISALLLFSAKIKRLSIFFATVVLSVGVANGQDENEIRDKTTFAISPNPTEETIASKGLVTGTTGASAQEAGIKILQAGGTAADAIVATAMTQICLAAGSWVSYAGLMNVIYYDSQSRKVYNMNASYDTVKGETDAETIPQPSYAQGFRDPAARLEPNGRSVLVPGFLKGAEALVKRFGALELEQVVAPSVRCAEEGFKYTEGLVDMTEFRKNELSHDPDTRAIYFKVDGSAYAAGEIFKQPLLAKTLRRFVLEGADYIYRGEWAEKLVQKTQNLGGKLSLEDLATYDVIWSEPVSANYHGFDVYVHGLPAAGGVNTLEALALLDRAKIESLPHYSESSESIHLLSNIGNVAIPLTYGSAAMSDALKIDLSLKGRLNPKTTDALWGIIQSGYFPGVTLPAKPAHSDAVVVVDKYGNIAAMVHSINTVAWGTNGINVDGISIPDSAAIQVSMVAETKPGERLPDPTNPGLIMKDGKPFLGFASIGSGLHQRTIAALVSVMDFGMTPQEAINAPAFGLRVPEYAESVIKSDGIQTFGEGDLTKEMLAELKTMGLEVKEDNSMRGYWIGIMIDPETGELRGGGPREFSIAMGGRAVGY